MVSPCAMLPPGGHKPDSSSKNSCRPGDADIPGLRRTHDNAYFSIDLSVANSSHW